MFIRLLLWLAIAPLLLAQNPTATMIGTVHDQTGSIVVGASVEIRNTDTDVVRKAVADARGEVTVPDLSPGPYEVTITHSGFRTVRRTEIVLEMDPVARMDFKRTTHSPSSATQTPGRRAIR